MDKYINATRLQEFFRARNKDLFSVATICSIIDAFPDQETIGGKADTANRFTKRDSDGAYVSTDYAWENGICEVRGGAINTLADYEDSGLTPFQAKMIALNLPNMPDWIEELYFLRGKVQKDG